MLCQHYWEHEYNKVKAMDKNILYLCLGCRNIMNMKKGDV